MRSLTTARSTQIGRFIQRPPARGPALVPLAITMLAALAAFMLFPGPVAATGDRQAERELRFYIESVAVEGVRRASPQLIVSESLLEAGMAYSEAELRQAVYRVGRLPFVLEADFSLGRGSERGRYSLLITIEEVRGFFFGSDLTYDAYGGVLADATPEDDGLDDATSAGLRVFAGQGVFFAAVTGGEGLQVGYERYRLADRPVYLRLAYAQEDCCTSSLQELGLDPGAAVWTGTRESDRLELTVGVPLGGNHSLRFDASRDQTGSAVRRTLGGGAAFDASGVEQEEVELAWVFDSTDDPVFPTRGDALTAAVGIRWLEGDLSESPVEEPAAAPGRQVAEMRSRLVGLSLYGARHWPLSARQTVSLSLKLLLSRSQVAEVPLAPVPGDGPALRLGNGDVDALEADFAARYSLSLGGRGKTRRLGELRWETVAGLIYLETSSVYAPLADPLWGVRLSSGIALRNTWGIFRIGFAFLELDGEL